MQKKAAVIDIGTNSFHMIIAALNDEGSIDIMEREREVIRLTAGLKEGERIIPPEMTDRAAEVLLHMKMTAAKHSLFPRAIATSALRESLNKNEFVRAIYERIGVSIEIIDGLKEAEFIYAGVLCALPVFDRKTLCIDIGGGSTEIVIGQKGRPLFLESLKIGAVRLSSSFFPDYVLTEKRINDCRKYVRNLIFLVSQNIRDIQCDCTVGSSGTIMSAAFIKYASENPGQQNMPILNNYVLDSDYLDWLVRFVLEHKTPDQRLHIVGLEDKRADVFPAGLIILDEIVKILNIKTIIVSSSALREGIIMDSFSSFCF